MFPLEMFATYLQTVESIEAGKFSSHGFLSHSCSYIVAVDQNKCPEEQGGYLKKPLLSLDARLLPTINVNTLQSLKL